MDNTVVFEDGARGRIVGDAPVLGGAHVPVQVEGGPQVMVADNLLDAQADGTYAVAARVVDLPSTPAGLAGDQIVVPVMEEAVSVGKSEVVTGGVRLVKTVGEREEIVDEALTRTQVEVTRVPVGRFVDEAPAPRRDGDTTILSVVEEVLVVERRLRLVEEVHIAEVRSEYHDPQTVSLRREEVAVERLTPAG